MRLIAFLIVVTALGLGIWLGYPILKEYSAALMELPAVKASLSTVGQRIGQAETRLQESMQDQQSTREQFKRLESGLDQRFQAARARAQEVADRLFQRVRGEWEGRARQLEMRLSGIEQERHAAGARMAALQDEVSQMRRELSRLDAEIAISRETVQSNLQAGNTRMGAIEERIGKGQRALETFSKGFERKRLEFEIPRNRSRELAPGVSIAITKLDARNRRVTGYISIGGRKAVAINNQSTSRPVVFHTNTDEKPRELVFTAVTKNSASGYMLVPVEAKQFVGSDAPTSGTTE